MGEDLLVKEQLTEAMIDAGAELTRKLDELGVPIDAAFWFFKPEINEWRLLFASPDVASKGPLDVYGRIRAAIDQLGPKAAGAPFSAVSLLDPGADLVKLLTAAVPTGNGLGRIRFSKSAVNGHYIDDALIYRTAAKPAPSPTRP